MNKTKNIKCKRIVGGITKGKLLFSEQPLNFLAMLNVKTGQVIDINHELINKTLKNNILVFPNSVGSSVGAYTIFSLKNNNTSPNGIICTNSVDITTASGCAISNIPLVYIDKTNFEELKNYLDKKDKNSNGIILDAEKETITLFFDNDKSI
jgi:predicted aconitase with swiveling domain